MSSLKFSKLVFLIKFDRLLSKLHSSFSDRLFSRDCLRFFDLLWFLLREFLKVWSVFFMFMYFELFADKPKLSQVVAPIETSKWEVFIVFNLPLSFWCLSDISSSYCFVLCKNKIWLLDDLFEFLGKIYTKSINFESS